MKDYRQWNRLEVRLYSTLTDSDKIHLYQRLNHRAIATSDSKTSFCMHSSYHIYLVIRRDFRFQNDQRS